MGLAWCPLHSKPSVKGSFYYDQVLGINSEVASFSESTPRAVYWLKPSRSLPEAKGRFCTLTHLPWSQPRNVLTQLFFLNPKNQPYFSRAQQVEGRCFGDLAFPSCSCVASGENFTSLSPNPHSSKVGTLMPKSQKVVRLKCNRIFL